MKTELVNTLQNLIANLGTEKDKAFHTTIQRPGLDFRSLSTMYVADWVTRKVIDIPVDDATRKWREPRGLSPEQTETFYRVEKALAVRRIINRAMKSARLLGASIVVLGIDGAGDLNQPLDLATLKPGSLKFLKVIEIDKVAPGPINSRDPLSVSFMYPETYRIGSTEIHSSRVLRFDGTDTPDNIRIENQFWSVSCIESIYDAVKNSATVNAAIGSLIYESKTDVIQIKGLMEMLATENGETLLYERFRLADKLKSLNNTLLLDGDETFIRNEYTFGGLADILVKFLLVATGSSDIPATRLLGTSASGLNATGEGDQSNYYDMVGSIQTDRLGPQMDRFDEIFLRSTFGNYPDGYSYEWIPLKQMSESETATVRKTQAETAAILIQSGALPPWILTAKLVDDGEYPGLDPDYVDVVREVSETPLSETGVEPPADEPAPVQAEPVTAPATEPAGE